MVALRFIAAGAVATALACSSPSSAVQTTTPADPATHQGSAGGADDTASADLLTDADCMALLDHYLAVASAEKPEEARPTSEQLAEIRSGMVDAAKSDCVGQPRSGPYDCAMNATSSQAIGHCLSGAGGPK